jgi:outer membrane protein assembly factor BamE (lipoprotein component of BamABCDE complex)
MKRLLAILAFISLAGCSTITDQIPSFWDSNQSVVVTDMQQMTRHIDCATDLKPQLHDLFMKVEWYDLYANTKGTKDMAKLDKVMMETIKEFQDKVAAGPISPMYCDLKKKVLIQQADIIATTVQGRF